MVADIWIIDFLCYSHGLYVISSLLKLLIDVHAHSASGHVVLGSDN